MSRATNSLADEGCAVEAFVVGAEPTDVSPALARPRATIESSALRPAQNAIALATIVLPLLGTIAAFVLAAVHGVGRVEVVLLVVGFALTSLGIEFGMHRSLAHRAFETRPSIKVLFAILGSMAAEGRIVYWVASHRRHHAHSDTAQDPHSPHTRKHAGKTEKLAGAAGIWHAHVGHMLTDEVTNCTLFARDLNQDPMLRRVNDRYEWIVVSGLLLPALFGWLWYGTLVGALSCFLWGGLLRMFLVHHTTWSVASFCHRFGAVRFRTGDQSRNNVWLALPSFGSAWQNNHHAFPNSAYLGLRWWEVDITGWIIRGCAAVGLVWRVRRPTPAQIDQQLAKASVPAPR